MDNNKNNTYNISSESNINLLIKLENIKLESNKIDVLYSKLSCINKITTILGENANLDPKLKNNFINYLSIIMDDVYKTNENNNTFDNVLKTKNKTHLLEGDIEYKPIDEMYNDRHIFSKFFENYNRAYPIDDNVDKRIPKLDPKDINSSKTNDEDNYNVNEYVCKELLNYNQDYDTSYNYFAKNEVKILNREENERANQSNDYDGVNSKELRNKLLSLRYHKLDVDNDRNDNIMDNEDISKIIDEKKISNMNIFERLCRNEEYSPTNHTSNICEADESFCDDLQDILCENKHINIFGKIIDEDPDINNVNNFSNEKINL